MPLARAGTVVEAFTAAKDPEHPDANEDQLLLLPGRAFAVIDGVTSRTGRLIDGETTGRVAARLVRDGVLRQLLDEPGRIEPGAFVVRLTRMLQEAHRAHGLEAVAANEPGQRLAATLALVMRTGETVQALAVGDSLIRINGKQLFEWEKPLDLVHATVRRLAWQALTEEDFVERDRICRHLVWQGLAAAHPDAGPLADADALAKLRASALRELGEMLPDVPADEITTVLDGGVVSGQGGFQNAADRRLGYPILDGTTVPDAMIRQASIDLGEVRSVELATDGYFRQPVGTKLADWEAAADEVERIDPFKIGRYGSAKCSIGKLRADDRTVVTIHFPDSFRPRPALQRMPPPIRPRSEERASVRRDRGR
jgi:hypothetical protein